MPKCSLINNYRFFGEKIDEWWSHEGQTAESLNSFILTLLDNVVLLPIHCGSEDDALSDPVKIMKSLKTIHAIDTGWNGNDEIDSLWGIMETCPNYYWNLPLFVFLHKHGQMSEETGDFVLPEEHMPAFMELLDATVQYFFIKGVLYNSVNAVRDTVFRVCADIEMEKDYLSDYKAISPRMTRSVLRRSCIRIV